MTAARILLLLLTVCFVALPAAGQDVLVSPLLRAQDCSRLVVLGPWVYTGTTDGGVTSWSREDPNVQRIWTHGNLLAGHRVSDLVWTDRHLWVATRDGGLTRLADLESPTPTARNYTTTVADLHVTCVTGSVVAGSERVFYGTLESGLGAITDGVPGDFYNSNIPGMPDDRIVSLVLSGGDLFFVTPLGVTRFADNAFTDANTGLEIQVNRLTRDGEGRPLALTTGGIYGWDSTVEAWSLRCCESRNVIDAAVSGGGLVVLDVAGGIVRVTPDDLVEIVGPVAPSGSAIRASVIGAADGVIWLGGRIKFGDMRVPESGASFAWLSRGTGGPWAHWWRDASLMGDLDGVAFDTLGRPWLGEANGDGLSMADADRETWSHVVQLGTADNDYQGLFNAAGGILGMVSARDGSLWFGQYTDGIIRYRNADIFGTATDRFDQITPDNSGLLPSNVDGWGSTPIRLADHPDGTIFVMSDWAVPDAGLEVLWNPGSWDETTSWMQPEIEGTTVWATLVERRDVVWVAVEQAGLVRWDVNGDGLETDPLTWADTSDDDVSVPLRFGDLTLPNLGATRALALDPAGGIWAGGNGLVHFRYVLSQDEQGRTVVVPVTSTIRTYWRKHSAFLEGLLADAVLDLGLDANGQLWVLTESGLNRIRLGEDGEPIDAWTDLETFLRISEGNTLYSDRVIAPLSGGTYRQLALSPDGQSVVVGSNLGAAQVTFVETEEPEKSSDLSRVFCYPNPFPGEGSDGLLRIDGLDADGGDPAQVVIYNLLGQVVFRTSAVAAREGFWDGSNRRGEAVASGLYVVEIRYRDQVVTKTLAVVD